MNQNLLTVDELSQQLKVPKFLKLRPNNYYKIVDELSQQLKVPKSWLYLKTRERGPGANFRY